MLLLSLFILITAVQADDPTAILYKYTDSYDWIWNDGGTGGKHYVSFWAPKITDGYCTLGDVANAAWEKPSFKALLVKSVDKISLKHPDSHSYIWYDRFSGGIHDVKVYRLNPPTGYTCLGDAVVRSWKTPPDLSRYCCVKNDFREQGNLHWTYNDKGTGSLYDFTAWTVKKVIGSRGLEGGNFLSTRSYNEDGLYGYLLYGDRSKVVNSEEGIKDTYVYDFKYDLKNEDKKESPFVGQTVVLENELSVSQTVKSTLSYETTKSSTFNFEKDVSIGYQYEVEAGIPEIGSAKASLSAKAKLNWKDGETKTIKIAHSIEVKVDIPPHQKIVAELVATEYKSDIPYTAKVRKIYYDGNITDENTSGIFTGVSIIDFHVVYKDAKNVTRGSILSEDLLSDPRVNTIKRNISFGESGNIAEMGSIQMYHFSPVYTKHLNLIHIIKNLVGIASKGEFDKLATSLNLTSHFKEQLKLISLKKDSDIQDCGALKNHFDNPHSSNMNQKLDKSITTLVIELLEIFSERKLRDISIQDLGMSTSVVKQLKKITPLDEATLPYNVLGIIFNVIGKFGSIPDKEKFNLHLDCPAEVVEELLSATE